LPRIRLPAEVEEEERTLLLAVRNPEATVASFSSIEVSFETGPALREFDYTIKCVLFDDALVDGCDADAVGAVVTGKTTTSKSTIEGEVTGLQSQTDYQCYVVVETDKLSKCKYVVTPIIEAEPVIRMASVNSNDPPVESFYTPDISAALTFEQIPSSTATNYRPSSWASIAGYVFAVSITASDPTEGGIWYTDDIEAWVNWGDDFPTGFNQLGFSDLTSIGAAGQEGAGFQIGFGNRMVAWGQVFADPGENGVAISDNWETNAFTTTTTAAPPSFWYFRYASVTGDLVAYVFNDGVISAGDDIIVLCPNAFASGRNINYDENIQIDLQSLKAPCSSCVAFWVTSVSLYGDYLAFTTWQVADGDAVSKIYYADLSTMTAPYTTAPTFVEVPLPTDWNSPITEGLITITPARLPLEVSIALGQMVVTFDGETDGEYVPNVAWTSDFKNAQSDDWIYYGTLQETHQQLSSADDIPGQPDNLVWPPPPSGR
jgi:hypothetical protein